MQTADRGTDRLRLAGIEFDTRTGELWKDGSRTVLPDQLFHVLAILIRERGSLVTRDELRGVLWPDDTFVDFEHGLNAAIKRLRETLGDRRRRRGSSKRFRGAATASSPRSNPVLQPLLPTLPMADSNTPCEPDPQTAVPEAQRPGESTRWTGRS